MSGILDMPAFFVLLVAILLVLLVGLVVIVVRASRSGGQLAQPGRHGMSPAPIAALPVAVPAGWYPQGKLQRYWDGTAWTEQTAPFA